MIFGVDLSSYQGKPDFYEMKVDGIEFVILRLIVKDGTIDRSFEYNFEQAKQVGMSVGVYVFSYDLDGQSSRERAEKAVKALKGRKLELPIFIDLEWSKQKANPDMYDIIASFKETVQAAGYRFGIYCNLDWYKNVRAIRKFDDPLWIARYGKNNGKYDVRYKPGVGEKIWQFTSNSKVNGIDVYCDKNIMVEDIRDITVKEDIGGLPDLRGYRGTSITSALHSYGYPSTFDYRKKVAEKVGIKGYTGKACQNLRMLEILSGLEKDYIPSLKGYKGFSVVGGLKEYGYKSDYEYREKLAEKLGIKRYKGTALQNVKMLNILKSR